jgi:GNAT superfamily N-acetyltransferase
LLATQRDAPQTVLMDLLARAQTQATQWQTPILVTPNAGADRLLPDVLRSFGFRSYYHYTLHEPTTALSTQDEAPAPTAGNLLERMVSTFWRARAESTVTTTTPVVRHATKRDLDAVIALAMQSLRYHATCEPTMQLSRREPQKMRGRFEQALSSGKHSTVLVAEWQRQIVGFYSIYIQTIDETWSPPLFASGRYGLIAEVAVDESFRGHGIGRQLFAAAEVWFHAHEAHRYWLIYLARNPLSSRFWTALGFETVWDVLIRDA